MSHYCVLSIGTTYEDYVQLAFLLHGSGWSIQVLNTLSDLTPFSNAFIQLNVDEIVLERKCLVCTCGRGCTIAEAASIDSCVGLVSKCSSPHMHLISILHVVLPF